MRIDLSWPPALLSPNARAHWGSKATAVKAYRRQCWAIASASRGGEVECPVHMTVIFHPPDKRRRDRDNMIAAMKAGMDGLADALGVDDRHFVPTYRVGDPVEGGRVSIQITSAIRVPFKGEIS